MSILSTLNRIAADYRAARARYLTERAIMSLPLDLQKDIGWPSTVCPSTGRRRREFARLTDR
ncbi:MAG: hypothetical protein AB7U35_12600 [Sphingobium sp.]